jgi:hypothetical protein
MATTAYGSTGGAFGSVPWGGLTTAAEVFLGAAFTQDGDLAVAAFVRDRLIGAVAYTGVGTLVATLLVDEYWEDETMPSTAWASETLPATIWADETTPSTIWQDETLPPS